MKKQCPYCHEEVSLLAYPGHVANHKRLLPDGQQADHVTLAVEERAAGDLVGVPRVYRHKKCGVSTVMPEEIVRSYLVNPFLYNGGTFCCGCNRYVPFATVRWEETGQTLADYFHELQQQAIREGRVPKSSTFLANAILILVFSTVGGGVIVEKAGGNGSLGALWGGILGSLSVALFWIIMRILKHSSSKEKEI